MSIIDTLVTHFAVDFLLPVVLCWFSISASLNCSVLSTGSVIKKNEYYPVYEQNVLHSTAHTLIKFSFHLGGSGD